VSNFVTGLVSRGAGLGQTVAISPATRPSQLPISATPSPGGELEGGEVRTEVTPFGKAQMVDAPRSAPAQRGEATSFAERVARPENKAFTQLEPAVFPVAQPQPVRASESHVSPIVPPRPTEASKEVEVRPMPASDPAKVFLRDASPTVVTPRLNTPAAVAVAQPEPRKTVIEPVATRRVPPARAAANPAAKTPESRGIQVKIGKVEIRTTQPAPVMKAARPRNTGFDDLRLTRAYLTRGAW
jgi:hypothetical protein